MTAESYDVTKTVYSVLDFLEWQRQGGLNLRPYFQRGNVWTPKAKSLFIDTLIRGYPVPVILMQYRTDQAALRTIRQVVDGQQRLRTIIAYLDRESLADPGDRDDFAIMRIHNRELAGRPFRQLPEDVRTRLLGTELSVHVLPSDLPDRQLLDIFARLNSTGTRLNDQELRNAEFHGVFKQLAYDLAYDQLDRWQRWHLFSPQKIAEMREVEFTSELMLLAMDGVQAKSKAALDGAYKRFDEDFPGGEQVIARLQVIFDELDELLSAGTELRSLQTLGWFHALAALLLTLRFPHGIADTSPPKKQPSTSRLRSRLAEAQEALAHEALPEDLSKALRGASTDRKSREARIETSRRVRRLPELGGSSLWDVRASTTTSCVNVRCGWSRRSVRTTGRSGRRSARWLAS